MKKLIVGGVSALAFMLPLAAFASVSVDNILFDNGTGNVVAGSGDSVPVTLYLNTSGTNDVESIFVSFPGAGGIAQQGQCYDITDLEGASPTNGWVSTFDITVPVNAGVWPIKVETHGTNGDDADQGCFTSADATQTFNSRITVTADNSTGSLTGNSGGSGTGTSGASQWSLIMQSLQAILAKMTAGSTPAPTPVPTPTVDPKCAMIAPYLGAPENTYSSLGVQLQSALLMDNPFSISVFAPGLIPPRSGFRGPLTDGALAAYNSNHHCN